MNEATSTPCCPICNSPSVFLIKKKRIFWECPVCTLIFTPQKLCSIYETLHYIRQWKNSSQDFWNKVIATILPLLETHHVPRRILDFGAGSGDFSKTLRSRGFDVTEYEPMRHVKTGSQDYPVLFDCIIALEVIEHIQNLQEVFAMLSRWLAPGGMLFFSTVIIEPSPDPAHKQHQFQNYWYKDDLTHVNFFTVPAIEMLASILGFKATIFMPYYFLFTPRQSGNTPGNSAPSP